MATPKYYTKLQVWERSRHNFEADLTSDGIGESKNDDESDEGLVLMLSDGKANVLDFEEEELVNLKLFYLNQTATEVIKSILSKYLEVIAKSFEDVRPSTVAFIRRCELTSNKTMYQKTRRMSLMRSEIVRKEVDRMLAAGIITPVE